MTSRPAFATKHRRPLSAIFLGNPALLPDLPEPPSTASSPSSSGLPSPPASNSTGSGSNGGDLSTESVRIPSSLMHNGGRPRSVSRSSSDDGDDGNDEDHTARLSAERRSSDESALQRVKELTQRNRLVLSKLASISSGSRLSTPSPTTMLRRSPAPSSSTSVASSRTRRRSESISRASGSETERETVNGGGSDSEGLSETPTSTTGAHFRSASVRERRTSAPIDSSKVFEDRSARERSVEPEEPRRQRTRPESRADDIEAAALAAVAKARQVTPSETRRQPSQLPQTPRRERTVSATYANLDSPSSSRATLHDSPMTPHTRATRFSSIRDLTRRHQTRGLSQDMTSPLKNGLDDDPSPSRRPANGDSPRRNFVGESLRAAGLVRLREEGDDVFGEGGRRLRISSEVGTRPPASRSDAPSRPGTRLSERPTAANNERYEEPRTPASAQYAVAQRNPQTTKIDRPSTSMAAYRDEPRTAPPTLRTYRSNYSMPDTEAQRDRQTTDLPSRPPSQARYAISSAAAHERSGSVASVRRTTASPLNLASAAAGDNVPEHTRLMLESLGMFESQLSRLPSLGSTTTVTIPELFRSAQNIVHAADGLSNMLRRGTAHALEEQIDAEVGEDGREIDLVTLWRDVGAEYRESVRVSDELVRTMTSFLLGVGKVLRESSSESTHNRNMSVDDSMVRRQAEEGAPVVEGSRSSRMSSDGARSSLDGRGRWMNSSGEMGRTNTSFTSASSTTSMRPSAIHKALADAGRTHRASASESISESDVSARRLARLSLASPRRLDSMSDLRDSRGQPSRASNGNDSFDMHGDSPSAAASARRENTLPRRSNTVAAPPPLSTLPSESLLTRRSSEKPSLPNRRPKTSGSTVRASNSMFPTLSSSGEPTTAINTAQASPERPRHVSTSSISRPFSRAGGAAAADLQQYIERDGRKRTVSATSAVESETRQARNAIDVDRSDTRPRASLDSNTSTATNGTFSARSSRDRRGTVTSLFSRN